MTTWNTTLGQKWPQPADRKPNPFSRDEKGQRNWTAISQAIKADRKLAKELCQAAKEPLHRWFMEERGKGRVYDEPEADKRRFGRFVGR